MIEINTFIESLRSSHQCQMSNPNFHNFSMIVDKNGRNLLHWIAFNGRSDLLTLLLENPSSIEIGAKSANDDNFSAIHFAVVNNQLECIRLLLDNGANIESEDMYGRTPLLIAAFYGRLSGTVLLLSRSALLQKKDINGNCALHLAAISGNPDLCQLLLYSGISVRSQNDLGETALHLAASRKASNRRMLKLLVATDQALIGVCDRAGLNPATHARLSGHKTAITVLRPRSARPLKRHHLLYGRGDSRKPLCFLIGMIFFWAIPFYLSQILPLTYSDHPWLACLFICNGLLFMITLYGASVAEPGYLPRCTRAYDIALTQLATSATDRHVINSLARLCHTCRTVQPLRAAHCAQCRRCVLQRDHHCPYLHTCIGLRNRQAFLLFLGAVWSGLALSLVYVTLLLLQYNFHFGWHNWIGIAIVITFFGFVSAALLSTLAAAFANTTANEYDKWRRPGYEYLRDEHDRFANSLDKGPLLNLLAYFRIIVEYRPSNSKKIDV